MCVIKYCDSARVNRDSIITGRQNDRIFLVASKFATKSDLDIDIRFKGFRGLWNNNSITRFNPDLGEHYVICHIVERRTLFEDSDVVEIVWQKEQGVVAYTTNGGINWRLVN
jgi:hypothetical protein